MHSWAHRGGTWNFRRRRRRGSRGWWRWPGSDLVDLLLEPILRFGDRFADFGLGKFHFPHFEFGQRFESVHGLPGGFDDFGPPRVCRAEHLIAVDEPFQFARLDIYQQAVHRNLWSDQGAL